MRATTAPQTPAHLPTQNDTWGFWGNLGEHAPAAWPQAFGAIQVATGADPEAVRAFLDSRHGRHFGDTVRDGLERRESIPAAVASAVATWMGWTIGRATSRDTGIPHGTPYLTGYVHQVGLVAEAA